MDGGTCGTVDISMYLCGLLVFMYMMDIRYLRMRLKRRHNKGGRPTPTSSSESNKQRIIHDLCDAIRSRNLSSVQQLIQENKDDGIGANINAPIDSMFAPVSISVFAKAILEGDVDIVNYLLEHGGADIHLHVGSDKETPLHLAVFAKNIDIIQLLLEHGSRVHANLSKMKGRSETIVKDPSAYSEVKLRNMVNAPDRMGRTPIHVLAMKPVHTGFRRYSAIPILNLLHENGGDVDAQDSEGNTALHMAVANGNVELVQRLLELAARYDIPNRDGRMAEDVFPEGWIGPTQRQNIERAKEVIRTYVIPSHGFKRIPPLPTKSIPRSSSSSSSSSSQKKKKHITKKKKNAITKRLVSRSLASSSLASSSLASSSLASSSLAS